MFLKILFVEEEDGWAECLRTRRTRCKQPFRQSKTFLPIRASPHSINNSKLQAGRERERERERIRSLQRKKPKQQRERERERGRGRRHKTWGGHDGGGKVILLSARVCTMVSAIAKFNLIGFQWVPVGSLVVEHWVVAQTG